MAKPKGIHIMLFVILCSRLSCARRVLISGNEKPIGLHSSAEVDMVGKGSGTPGGGGGRSASFVDDWSCGSDWSCPCGPPCYYYYFPFQPPCSGWVMGVGLSTFAPTTKPALTPA